MYCVKIQYLSNAAIYNAKNIKETQIYNSNESNKSFMQLNQINHSFLSRNERMAP